MTEQHLSCMLVFFINIIRLHFLEPTLKPVLYHCDSPHQLAQVYEDNLDPPPLATAYISRLTHVVCMPSPQKLTPFFLYLVCMHQHPPENRTLSSSLPHLIHVTTTTFNQSYTAMTPIFLKHSHILSWTSFKQSLSNP